MQKFITSLTAVATLTLAAVPALGLVQAAHAAEPTATIMVGNLHDPIQAASFQQRVETQGDALCRQVNGPQVSRVRQSECMTQVRLDVTRQLGAAQRHALRHAAAASPMQIAAR